MLRQVVHQNNARCVRLTFPRVPYRRKRNAVSDAEGLIHLTLQIVRIRYDFLRN